MKSHAMKIIVAGRLLEMMMGRKKGLRASELNDMLKHQTFSPTVALAIRNSKGISSNEIAGILKVLAKTDNYPRAIIPTQLVKSEGNNGAQRWHLNGTASTFDENGRHIR